MEDNGNLKIWSEVCRTAPSGTKEGCKVNGQTITSINGTYMAQEATRLFGPMGHGWGCVIKEERFDQGAPIFNKNDELIYHESMHTLIVELWYLGSDGEKKTITHYGHTPYVMRTQYGPKTDFDAPKKSLTDAMKKCLSMLGFSADIYLGYFDDVNYVAAAKTKEAIETADNADEQRSIEEKKFWDWVKKEIETYDLIPNPAAMRNVYNGHISKAERQCAALSLNYQAVHKRFTDRFENAYDALKQKAVEKQTTGKSEA